MKTDTPEIIDRLMHAQYYGNRMYQDGGILTSINTSWDDPDFGPSMTMEGRLQSVYNVDLNMRVRTAISNDDTSDKAHEQAIEDVRGYIMEALYSEIRSDLIKVLSQAQFVLSGSDDGKQTLNDLKDILGKIDGTNAIMQR